MLNTLRTIIDDILLAISNENISESMPISRIQIEQWIVQYRSILIKQDIDKGRDINRMYVQDIDNIQLEQIVSNNGMSVVLRSINRIPTTIDFHFASGIVDVRDKYGNEIQISTERRALMQLNRRYTSLDYMAYKKGDRLYLAGPSEIRSVNISIIASNPSDVAGFSEDHEYPIPANMIPVMREMILNKEIRTPRDDDKNNSKDDSRLQQPEK